MLQTRIKERNKKRVNSSSLLMKFDLLYKNQQQTGNNYGGIFTSYN